MNNRNTVGEALFVRDTRVYPAPKDDDPLPGSIVRVDASGAVVMSDAAPDPLIMGAQYAQAQEELRYPSPSPPRSDPQLNPTPACRGTCRRRPMTTHITAAAHMPGPCRCRSGGCRDSFGRACKGILLEAGFGG